MKKFDIKDIKIFLQNLTDREGDKYTRKPYKVWVLIVVVAFLLFLFVGFVHYQIFLQTNSEDSKALSDPDEGKALENIDVEALEDTLELYRQKETAFEKLKTNKLNVVDPSL